MYAPIHVCTYRHPNSQHAEVIFGGKYGGPPHNASQVRDLKVVAVVVLPPVHVFELYLAIDEGKVRASVCV